MPEYHEAFRVGEKIRIKSKEYLLNFKKSWKYHNNITNDQIEYGGQEVYVDRIGAYHGGNLLYELKDVPGVWHEQLLEENIPKEDKFIPASEYYKIGVREDKIIITGKNGKEYRLKPEWGGVKHCVEAMRRVSTFRTKEGFESRYRFMSFWKALKSIKRN
jgi:hypothetical protein